MRSPGSPPRDTGVETFGAADLPTLCDQAAAADPRLQTVLDRFGYPPFWSRPNTFESLVWFILEQQVSLASARAALEKLRDRVGTITPEAVTALDDADLRAAYFSRQKTGYVRALAEELRSGALDLAALEQQSDAAVRERLVRLHGVGNWTVDVYLIMVLHRVDVFPLGDLAAVNALKKLKGLARDAPRIEVDQIAATWSPLRTVATMILWHDYLSVRGKGTAGPSV